MPSRRADAEYNRELILETAARLLDQSRGTTLADVASAAGLSRSTVYRHFGSRENLAAAVASRRETAAPRRSTEEVMPPGQLGRERPVQLDALHVLDVVAPPVLPEQLVAEAERIAKVPLALYVLDIDGSHLLRMAGPESLPERLDAPLAVGPELDAAGLSLLREQFASRPGTEIVPLWLRGRATGVLLTVGPPAGSLAEIARQASAAIALADRYTDTFARAQRRKQPKAAAEMQQSMLPPRIARVTGGEVAGNVLPSYEVAGDWFDVVQNLDGVWITIADGLGGATKATASAAVALGALRASRRSGASISEALLVMHATLKEMPGPRTEMTALAARWDPARHRLVVCNCGHVPAIVVRADGSHKALGEQDGRGLGGRSRPDPAQMSASLSPGDRLILISDGVVRGGEGKAGLGLKGVVEAALSSQAATAPDTVRKIHTRVLDETEGDLKDDATAVCLAVG